MAATNADENLNEEQRHNMKQFLEQKSAVIKSGELRNEDFERIEELGHGSGGAVLKVLHKPTTIVMARKVVSAVIKITNLILWYAFLKEA